MSGGRGKNAPPGPPAPWTHVVRAVARALVVAAECASAAEAVEVGDVLLAVDGDVEVQGRSSQARPLRPMA